MIKMYAIFCRETLALFEGNEGKLGAQAGHAFLHAFWDAEDRFYDDELNDDYSNTIYNYRTGNDARKIVLVVDTIDEMIDIYLDYRFKCGTTLVEDCGYTIFKEPTFTCVGIGPLDDSQKCDKLRNIELLRHEL